MADINKDLKKAVSDGDLEKVKGLLSRGANVNLRIKETFDTYTLLHSAGSAEMTKLLLKHGAAINATNNYRETPLHFAVTGGKGLALVRELLKHGAWVNATNRTGNTPLNNAVRKSGNHLEIIEELLEYGADINIRNRNYGTTSLDDAAMNLEYGKLLIKMTLIKNFHTNYKKIIDLSPYTEFRYYSDFTRFLDDCVCEILQMKTYAVRDNFSLYEFVIKKRAYIKNMQTLNKITELLPTYPIYHDMISAKIKLCLERANLFNKLNECQIYMRSDTSNQKADDKEVILNSDCANNIAVFLCNDDLSNFVKAFYIGASQTLYYSDSIVKQNQTPGMKLDESASCAKRAKLE